MLRDIRISFLIDFIEGNSWNISFHVPHDVAGLIRLMGGEKKFVSRLDTLFSMALPRKYYEKNEDIAEVSLVGGYVHGNEPSHHIAYLYNYTGSAHKTQYLVNKVLTEMYKNAPDGLIGNEDCGQMSAWYVLSSLGFYPVTPGSGQYMIGSPLFPLATINLENEKAFIINSPGAGERNFYIQQALLSTTASLKPA